MQKVVGQNPHLQHGLVGLEPLAAGLIPTQGVFAFLDPVFYLGPAIIDLDHLTGRQPGVGDHKADPGEKLALMPLDLGHYPARPAPTLGLVMEVNDLDLNAAFWRSPYRSVQVRSQEAHQVGIVWQSDEISDPLLFAIIVGFRFGKSSVGTHPKKLEPGAVTLHQGSDKWKSAVGGMDVPRSQLCPQTIALAGKAKKRMETVLGKMAIVGNPFLLAVGRVLGGIQIDYKPLFVLSL